MTRSSEEVDSSQKSQNFPKCRQPNISDLKIAVIFCAALTFFYLSFSPSTIAFMGYMEENITAADQLAGDLIHLARLEPLSKIEWTHHGCTETILEAPFILLSKFFFGESRIWMGRVLLLQTILATSLLCTLILLWVRRLTGSRVWGYLLALFAGVATMLWPYAYIGMETTQSLFLFGAAYLVLLRDKKGSWSEAAQLGLACAVAVSAKMNGIFLLPAVGFLLLIYFTKTPTPESGLSKSNWPKYTFIIGLIVFSVILNRYTRNTYWAGQGGEENYLATIIVDSPLTFVFNLFNYFGSANKSLFIFAPIVILSFLGIRRAYKAQPAIVIWALLTLSGLAGGFALMVVWSEETWGPRYLHSAIAPLLLCFAASVSGRPFRWQRELPLLATVVLGVFISFLGVVFHYGCLYVAAKESSHSSLEAFQHDPRFNHLRFNLNMLRIWGRARLGLESKPELWPPEPFWWFARPADAPAIKQVDLRETAIPMPVLFRGWNAGSMSERSTYRVLRKACFGFLVLGLIGLWRVGRMAGNIEVIELSQFTAETQSPQRKHRG
ncbi:MAG: glycosyltransferase family 39 protein [Blastocatellia bacterium]|nr:glycosyltransferase family 39 protein [Blastocatellia bacterium]